VHIITRGALLAPEKLLYLSTQLDLLSKTDLSKLTANQKAEHIATKAADIIKKVLAERAGEYIASKIPLPSAPTHSPTPQTVAELTTADGSTFKVTIEDETSILKNASDKIPLYDNTLPKFTSKQIWEEAKKLGFRKTNFYSHGQPIFQKGNRFITPDIDSHSGGTWKMADSVRDLASKKTRMGTYDKFLNRIGD
jgi:hypothetical protein